MGIPVGGLKDLAMSRRAVSALSWTGKSTGGTPVELMGKMPMLWAMQVFIHALTKTQEHFRPGGDILSGAGSEKHQTTSTK
jgi:hypothetical protein